jgi:membrane protease YdiL (CAAX protease family)
MERSRDETRGGILTYLVCTFALSSIYYTLIIRAGHLSAAHGLYVLGLMWCPGIAAILTCLIRRRPLSSLGWKWRWRYQAISYLIPIAYAGVAYAFVWATGLGGVPNPKVLAHPFFSRLSPQTPAAVRLIVFVLATGTLGMIASTMSALGEEIGWRGFLVPELAKMTTFTRTALVSGVIWTAWHVPILVFADYNSGTPTWYGLTCFAVMVIGISFVFAWMRLKSGSLWTGAFLHASHNLFIQGIFTPLTIDTGKTKWAIDEFGFALAIAAVVAAVIVWRRRGEVEAATNEPRVSNELLGAAMASR